MTYKGCYAFINLIDYNNIREWLVQANLALINQMTNKQAIRWTKKKPPSKRRGPNINKLSLKRLATIN